MSSNCTDGWARSAAAMASNTSARRPSLKFGTHSTSDCMDGLPPQVPLYTGVSTGVNHSLPFVGIPEHLVWVFLLLRLQCTTVSRYEHHSPGTSPARSRVGPGAGRSPGSAKPSGDP